MSLRRKAWRHLTGVWGPGRVFAWLAAVVQNVGVIAATFFQSVSEDGQTVKGSLVVNALSQLDNSAIVPCQQGTPHLLPLFPSSLGRQRAEGVADDVTNEMRQGSEARLKIGFGKHNDAEDRKSTRLNSSHRSLSRMPSSA